MTDQSYADITERLFCTFEAVHPLPVITPSGAKPELLERLARQRLTGLQPAP